MNVMTEEEAKGKWCPFARSTISRTITENKVPRFIAMASANRDEGDGDGPLYSLCIASGCMAWRWRREYRETFAPCDRTQMRVMPHDKPPGDGWRSVMCDDNPAEPYRNYDNDRKASTAIWERDHVGYCGLAGSPTP